MGALRRSCCARFSPLPACGKGSLFRAQQIQPNPAPFNLNPHSIKLWADGTFSGGFVEHAQAIGIDVEITTRLSDRPSFEVIPWRWVVERTFAWLSNYRRLSKDYEYWVYTSDAMLYASMVHLMVRRLARLQSMA